MFVELAARTNFSFLRGGSAPRAVVEQAKKLGYDAIGVTDCDGLYGMVRALEAADELGVRLVVGCEMAIDARIGPSGAGASPGEREGSPLLDRVFLHVATGKGYANLCHLLSVSHERHPKGQARKPEERVPRNQFAGVPLDLVCSYPEGLWCLAPPGGRSGLAKLKEAFGDRLSIAAWRHLDGDDDVRIARAESLSRDIEAPVCATNRVLFATRRDKLVFDVLHCIREGVTLDGAGRALLPNAEAHLKSEAEMTRLFRGRVEWLARSREIAEASRFSLRELRYRFPSEIGDHGRDARRAASPAHLRGRRGPLPPRSSRQGADPDREGARPHREDRGRAVLPERRGHRGHGARPRHPLPGARERREQRGLLLPRHHGDRPGAEQPPLRALPLRRASRAAGHRRRLRARAPRRSHPGDLRHLWPRPRGDGERGHLVPGPERAARGGQGVRAVARAGRPDVVARLVVGLAERAASRPRRGLRLRPGRRARAPGAGDGVRDPGVPAAPVDPRGRLRHQRRAARERRARRAGHHAQAHRHPVGQGRSRYPRLLQGRRARPRHAHGHPESARFDWVGGARARLPCPWRRLARRTPSCLHARSSSIDSPLSRAKNRPSTTPSARPTRSACSRSRAGRRWRCSPGSRRGASTTWSSRSRSSVRGPSRAAWCTRTCGAGAARSPSPRSILRSSPSSSGRSGCRSSRSR